MRALPVILFIIFSACEILPFTYPLQIGNRWVYGENIGSYYYTTTITGDTIMPNGKKYFIEQHSYPDEVRYSYIRFEADILYSYNEGETIICDFRFNHKDTVKVEYGEYDTVVTTLWIEEKMIFGQNTKTYSYISIPNNNTGWYQLSYADGFGFIEFRGEPNWSYGCYSAYINGRQYGAVTSGSDDEHEILPSFGIKQNYPNPFNPLTTISFSIPVSNDLILALYNSLGEQAAVLYSGYLTAGEHSFRWNASDFPAGNYICRLRSREYSDSIKLVLLK